MEFAFQAGPGRASRLAPLHAPVGAVLHEEQLQNFNKSWIQVHGRLGEMSPSPMVDARNAIVGLPENAVRPKVFDGRRGTTN